jgi:hypothetical protein
MSFHMAGIMARGWGRRCSGWASQEEQDEQEQRKASQVKEGDKEKSTG